MGMRPLLYHHSPGRLFVMASEARAIHAMPQVSCRIDEGRIADYLVGSLEGIDTTSTFHEGIIRLPPAHAIAIEPRGIRLQRYWTLEPVSELKLRSQSDYNEAFLEVFSDSVRCRLRSAGPVGSMLSGGMDSGSVVAVARGLLAQQNRGPLQTFSCVGPDPTTCVETRAIHAAITMAGLQPHLIGYDQLGRLIPQLGSLSWNLTDPFDHHSTLSRSVYLAAHQRGIKVMLDGVGGDLVLTEGRLIPRLLLHGRWLGAYREARGQERFWGQAYPSWHELRKGARVAAGMAMPAVQRIRQSLSAKQRLHEQSLKTLRESLMDPGFAERIGLDQRLQIFNSHHLLNPSTSYSSECAQTILHPALTVGRERYDRVASAMAIEPRDPFLDRRVIEFCLALPAEQKQHDGWPKIILRRAMEGLMPDAVRWRTGKQHLGWAFTKALLGIQHRPATPSVAVSWDVLAPYLSAEGMSLRNQPNLTDNARTFDLEHLATWLSNHQTIS
jgi:asparagine synthase (glutamine-hydrolysing)